MLWTTLAIIIVLVLIGIVIIYIIVTGSKIATTGGDKEQCLSSIRAQAAVNLLSPGTAVNLRCTTEQVKSDETDATKQKGVLASSMARCWEEFGEGKVKLFQIQTGSYCVVCSHIEFTKPQKLDHFMQYLMENAAPGKSVSYYSYLFNVEGTPQLVNQYRLNPISNQDTLDVSHPVAVMYVAEKKVDATGGGKGPALAALAGVAAAGVVLISGGTAIPALIAAGASGGAVGFVLTPYLVNQDFKSAVVLWPYDTISQLQCNRLEGKAGPLDFVT